MVDVRPKSKNLPRCYIEGASLDEVLAARTGHPTAAQPAPWLELADPAARALSPDVVEARVARTTLGEAIKDLFWRFSEFTPEIRPMGYEVMPDHLHFGGVGRLFAEGFQDTILFHAGQLDNMFAYLRDNARRRAIKALYPDLFRTVGELEIELNVDQGAAGCPVPRAKARGVISALGNRFLLARPLAQVQVSRRFFGYERVAKPGKKQSCKSPKARRGF